METGFSHTRGPLLPKGLSISCRKRIRDAAHDFPDNLALVSMYQPGNLYRKDDQGAQGLNGGEYDYLRWTYRQLQAAGDRLAAGLAAAGAGEDTAIFTFMPSGVEFVLILWSCLTLGCRFVPLSPRNANNHAELSHMVKLALQDAGMKEAFVIAQGDDTIAKLDDIDGLESALRFCVSTTQLPGWLPFKQLLETTEAKHPSSAAKDLIDKHTDSAIFFTSGTTAFPKGVHLHHPHFPSAMITTNAAAGSTFCLTAKDVFAVVGPNNHLLCHLFMMSTLSAGATVVFPSGNFDADALVMALEKEKITHTAVAPMMVQQMVSTKAKLVKPLKTHLRNIMMGGSGVSSEVLKMCTEQLGAERVEVVYGNTEGVWINSGPCVPSTLIRGGNVLVGTSKPGCQIKICAPGSKDPVQLGKAGELHFQGPSLVGDYILLGDSDFYDTNGERWLSTGDQAIMYEDGQVSIVGRYKEMIIRGGENISPVAIETCIQRTLPHLAHLQLQIAGSPDRVAGEVPVAITAEPVNEETVAVIKQAVVASMGQMYAIDEVLAVGDLGMSQFPRTTAGKSQRLKLKEALRQRFEEVKELQDVLPQKTDGQSYLAKQVRRILARSVGLDANDLSMSTELATIGDSISLMRFKDRLFKAIGRRLTLEDMASARTVSDLVSLSSTKKRKRDDSIAWTAFTQRPPKLRDIISVNAVDQKDTLPRIKDLISQTIESSGLCWDDVREVFPAYDFTHVQVENDAFSRWSLKIALVARNKTVSELRRAMVTTLANNPMQASFIVRDSVTSSLHVVVEQDDEFLQRRISRDTTTVPTVGDLDKIVLADTHYPCLPGPLVYASLYHCEEENCAAAIFNMHHSVTDASFLQIILEDLDAVLSDKPLQPHVSYRLWCESFFALRSSLAAQESVNYHVDKLWSLAKHQPHIWPPFDLPKLPEDGLSDGYIHHFPAQGVFEMCKRHQHLTPSLILKAATALFLLQKTGHTHALFAHVEAARDSVPFMPASLAAAARLEASDVGGQLFQSVVNCINIETPEKVLDFLTRLQAEQEVQHQYCAAPWKEIMRKLPADSGALFPVVAAWCMFNWLGTTYIGDKAFDNLEIVSTAARRVIVPFVNNCALERRKEGDRIMLHLRGSVFEVEELRGFAEQLEDITRWLVQEENECLQVGQYSNGGQASSLREDAF